MSCSTFRRWLYHFQEDQLPDDQRATLQAHLDGCEDCAGRLRVEEEMLGVLRSRLPRVPAPPGLETRVRAALDGLSSAPRLAWYRRPVFAALAASLLLAVLLLPGVNAPGIRGLEGDFLKIVGEEIVVVDVDCDHAGRSLAEQRTCSAKHHLNVFKTSDGSYWNINLDREAHRRLLVDRDMRGHRLVVDGRLFPRILTLQMTGYTDLGSAPL